MNDEIKALDGSLLYYYRAKALRIVDGDTVVLDVDLGFQVHFEMKVRMAGINTPEITGVKKDSPEYAAGKAAKTRLEELAWGKNLIIKTAKDSADKYGRYLATIFVEALPGSINQQLIEEGHAKPYHGEARP